MRGAGENTAEIAIKWSVLSIISLILAVLPIALIVAGILVRNAILWIYPLLDLKLEFKLDSKEGYEKVEHRRLHWGI